MKEKSESRLKIAYVIPPITLYGSGLANRRKRDPIEEWLFKHGDPVVFSNYRKQWVELWRVFFRIDGFVWLFLKLPLKLIRGKYSLFMVAARDPQAIITFVVSKLLRKPIIVSDSFYYWPERLLARLVWPFFRFASSHATVFNAGTRRVKSFWESGGVPESEIGIYHTFMSMIKVNDESVTLSRKLKQELGYQKVVLSVGRLVKEKGGECLIRAFEKLSKEATDVALLIIGDGPERNKLEELCRNLRLHNVVFTGFVGRDNIAPYYLMSDVFVFPSIRMRVHEEWGLVVNEAMSVGKPVIVSASVGCAYEVVEDGVTGYIIPDGNVNALYETMRKLICNDELRIRMGEEARNIIFKEFTYEHAIENCKNLINDAVKRQI